MVAHPDKVKKVVADLQKEGAESFRQLRKTLAPYLTPAEKALKRTYPDVEGFRRLIEHAQQPNTEEFFLERHMERFQKLLHNSPQFFRRLPEKYQNNVRGAVEAYEAALSRGVGNVKTEAEKGVESKVAALLAEGKSTEQVVDQLADMLHNARSQELKFGKAEGEAVMTDLSEEAANPHTAEGGIYEGLKEHAGRPGGFQSKNAPNIQAYLGNKIRELLGPEAGDKRIAAVLSAAFIANTNLAPEDQLVIEGVPGMGQGLPPSTKHQQMEIATYLARAKMEFPENAPAQIKAVKAFYPYATEAQILGRATPTSPLRHPKGLTLPEKLALGSRAEGAAFDQALRDLTSPDQEIF
jgi:hypothetical protein